MERKYNPTLTQNAKSLRKDMTKEERHLWYDFLRDYPIRFVRQKVLGRYIADFYCARAKLVIELDGSQHYEENEKAYDLQRTKFLHSEFGISVLRIPNNEISGNFANICDFIDAVVTNRLRITRKQAVE